MSQLPARAGPLDLHLGICLAYIENLRLNIPKAEVVRRVNAIDFVFSTYDNSSKVLEVLQLKLLQESETSGQRGRMISRRSRRDEVKGIEPYTKALGLCPNLLIDISIILS